MKVYKLWLHRFPKASDTVNRDILWHKLPYIGVKERLSSAFKALYNKVICAVKINGSNFCGKMGLEARLSIITCPVQHIL